MFCRAILPAERSTNISLRSAQREPAEYLGFIFALNSRVYEPKFSLYISDLRRERLLILLDDLGYTFRKCIHEWTFRALPTAH